MKHIKKFSQLVTESSDKAAEIQEVVKKLGYGSLKEIQQEKSLLTKLESLMKELAKSSDVSEDEAEEIEARVIAKGEPKSLANKMGKKEEDGEPGGSNEEEEEVDEDAAEDIEDAKLKLGEPESHGEDEGDVVVTKDQEVEEEPETSPEDEEAGIKIPKSRIMSFEQFVKESVNEGAVKAFEMDFAELVKQIKGGLGWIDPDYVEETWENMNLNSVDYSIVKKEILNRLIKAGVLYYAERNDPESKGKRVTSLAQLGLKEQTTTVNKNVSYRNDAEEEDDALPVAEDTAEEIEAKIVALGKPRKHSGAKGNVAVTKDQEITQVVTEQKVSNEKEFEEYAMAVLKKAHPDDFDQEVADKVVSGLKSKYKSDFGAMVGALQSSMGK